MINRPEAGHGSHPTATGGGTTLRSNVTPLEKSSALFKHLRNFFEALTSFLCLIFPLFLYTSRDPTLNVLPCIPLFSLLHLNETHKAWLPLLH